MTEITSESGKKTEVVYILENESLPDNVIKIGKTSVDNIKKRMVNLNNAVPLPFTCAKASLVENSNEAEKFLHQIFEPAKKQWQREFFEVEAWRVAQVLEKCFEVEDITKQFPNATNEEQISINNTVTAKERREKTTFATLGIDIGEKLSFVDDPNITCEVKNDDTTVLYNEEEFTLSALARKLKKTEYALHGIRYWLYKDETLIARRNRLADTN